MPQTIGFIGLGIMGRPMAKNLLKAGFPLVVHSRSRAAVEDLVQAGAKAAALATGGGRAVGRPRHRAAQLARRRGGRPREGRHHRGCTAWPHLRRHVHHLSHRFPEGRSGSWPNGRPDARRPGLGWRERGHRRGVVDHGRAASGSVFERCPAHLSGHGQDHHAAWPSGLWRVHQARQSDHRGRQPHRPGRGTHPGPQGRPRPRADPQGTGRRARRLAMPGPKDTQLRCRGPTTPASRSTCTSRIWDSSWSRRAPSGFRFPTTAVVQELFSALRVKGRGGLDHSGVITLLEELAGLTA